MSSARDKSRAPPRPVAASEFSEKMARLVPFEIRPRLAVAVSGGADSMALLLLAVAWAKACHGSVTALTVDHGLRPEAAAEAKQVGVWLARRGIDHRILEWREAHPTGNVQAQARAARYRLLEAWCAENGVFHLLLAHHREDQAETLLLRLARGSGLDGLAGMAMVSERASCRRLRPLLEVPRDRLRALLIAEGQEWIEDPSNENIVYARVRLRRSRALLAQEGLTVERLAATTARLARARVALEQVLASLLARAASPHPGGFVRVDPAALLAAPEELSLRALAAIVAAVGGIDYPPRLERLERLYRDIKGGLPHGRTLGGCRILSRHREIFFCREAVSVAAPVAALPGKTVEWDRRFRLSLPPGSPSGLTIGALGPGKAKPGALPAVIRATLPALRDDEGVIAVPALGFLRKPAPEPSLGAMTLLLRSPRPMTGAGGKVV